MSHKAARDQVAAVEKGVCRICGLDARGLYERVKVMAPPERHQELLKAGFKVTSALTERPNEGMFWQADHIVPVAEGGGEADLSNIRTLCTICHQKETKNLHHRLKTAGWGKGTQDLMTSMRLAANASAQAQVADSQGAAIEVG